jgi:hypothetical protein
VNVCVHIDKDNGNRKLVLPRAGRDLAVTFISEAMKRALADLRKGPADRMNGSFYLGAGDNRLLIRRQTVTALRLCGLVTVRMLPGWIERTEPTAAGHVYAAQNPPRVMP